MDNNLLTLWQQVPSGRIKQKEIADILGLSTKQVTRNIQKWEQDGWLTFEPGHGRGNLSKLFWLKNVEDVFETVLLKMIDEQPIETISKYLIYNWSNNSKLRLMNKFRSKFGFNQKHTELDTLVIPKKYPFLTIHPLEAADLFSVNMVSNLFNRLVFVDHTDQVHPELAHSWDLMDSKLRIYLKKDIKFHDGSLLHAKDVIACLNRLRLHKNFRDLWEPITEISYVSPFIIDIHYPYGCSYCLQMLGTMNASIYKDNNGQVIGTGCFYIGEDNSNKTSLVAFKDYFQERPLLDVVEFVRVPEDFEIVYRSASNNEENSTFQVESDSGFGIVLMNTFRNSAIKKKEVRDYLHFVIAKYRHEINKLDPRIKSNDQSCLIGQKQHYEIPNIKRPEFTEPLILRGINFTKNTTLWLKGILEKEGVPIKIKWLSFSDSLNQTENNDVDLFIHSEIFEMNQSFSFFYFLKNGYSPLVEIIKTNDTLSNYLKEYLHTPFENWTTLNLRIEKTLFEASIMIPLYYEKRYIPFATDLMNVKIKHFGYVDFSKLWVRPSLN